MLLRPTVSKTACNFGTEHSDDHYIEAISKQRYSVEKVQDYNLSYSWLVITDAKLFMQHNRLIMQSYV